MVRSGATRPTWIKLDPLLRQAFNLRRFSPHELPFLQIIECSLLIQIKNRGATNRPDAHWGHLRRGRAPWERKQACRKAPLTLSPADIEDSGAPGRKPQSWPQVPSDSCWLPRMDGHDQQGRQARFPSMPVSTIIQQDEPAWGPDEDFPVDTLRQLII